MRTQSNDQQDVGAAPASSAVLVKRPPPLRFPGKKSAEQAGEPLRPTPSTTSSVAAGFIPQETKSSLLASEMQLSSWRGNLIFFTGINATRPSESFEDLGWPAFKQKLCPAEPTLVTDKKDAPYFLPCLLRNAPLTGKTLEHAEKNGEPTVGKMRSKDHVTESNALLFDFDGIEESAFDQIRSYIEKQGLTYVAYTTFSHGLEDKSGMYVRVCLPVDQPLDAEAYPVAWDAFAGLLAEALESDQGQSGQEGA